MTIPKIFYIPLINVFFAFILMLQNTQSNANLINTSEQKNLQNVLNIFIQKALETNPSIQAADANITAAYKRQQASSQPIYNPAISMEGQKSNDKFYTIGLNQTIDWSSKRDARTRVGTANLEVAKAQRLVLQQNLIFEILDSLVSYQTTQETLKLTKEKNVLLKQFVELTQKRQASGDAAGIDIDLANFALSEALAQEAYSEENLNKSLQVLQSTTGLKQTDWPKFPTKLPHLIFDPLKTDDLINNLYSVKLLSSQYVSAQERVNVARKERYSDPTISLKAGKERSNGSNSILIGLNISLPLFIRNTYGYEVEAAHQDTIEAEKKRLDILRQARAEIENNAKSYIKLYQKIEQWQTFSSKPLQESILLLKRLWESKYISATDYLVQLKQRIDNQIAGAELQGHAWKSWINWLKSSGNIEDWVKNINNPGSCEQIMQKK